MQLFSHQFSAAWRDKFAAIQLAVPMIAFTPEGVVLEVNDLFLSSMGYSRGEVMGQPHRIFAPRNLLPVMRTVSIGKVYGRESRSAGILNVYRRMEISSGSKRRMFR